MILIYDNQGKILQTIEISDPIVEENYDPSPNFKIAVEGRYKPDEYQVVNGAVTPLPAKPNPYATFDFGQRQWITDNLVAAAGIRFQRNQELADSDWTQGKDVPSALSESWAQYRQALRDIPQQPGFPSSIEWPNKPQ